MKPVFDLEACALKRDCYLGFFLRGLVLWNDHVGERKGIYRSKQGVCAFEAKTPQLEWPECCQNQCLHSWAVYRSV